MSEAADAENQEKNRETIKRFALEDSISASVDLASRFIVTLVLALFPWRMYRPGVRNSLAPPYSYLTLLAFAAIVILRRFQPPSDSAIGNLLPYVEKTSLGSVLLLALPVALFAAALAKAIGGRITGPTTNVADSDIAAYIGGTQLGYLAIAWLLASTLAAIPFSNIDINAVWVFGATVALLVLPMCHIASWLVVSRPRPSWRARALGALLLLIFSVVNPIVAGSAVLADGAISAWKQTAERKGAFSVPMATTLIRGQRDTAGSSVVTLTIRNTTKNTYVLQRHIRCHLADRSGAVAKAEETVELTIAGWSAGDEPIMLVRPQEVAWVSVSGLTLNRGSYHRRSITCELPSYSVTPSGEYLDGFLKTERICIETSGDSIKYCGPVWD